MLWIVSTAAGASSLEDLRRAFINPPRDARILMRWWWFGAAVTKSQLEHEIRQMKDGGIDGFEIQAVYPVALDDPSRRFRNLPFLSPEFLDALHFTAEKARDLGLRMDLTLGSGWPYGGPQVPITLAAGRLRWVRATVAANSRRVALPDIGTGEKLIAAFPAGGGKEFSEIHDGVLWLRSGERPKEVWFFIAGRTGMMVKRAAVGAEGFVLDHYDRAALNHYLEAVAEPMVKAAGAPYSVFCDSLEVYNSDWTGDFPEEFRKRRGYDLIPHLPALVTQAPETRALRQDWGRTLTELLEERFIAPLNDWARAHGTRLRMQAYGIPPAALSSNAFIELPEGEGAQWKSLTGSRWAASAGHIYGRPVISSETWTWLHSPSFRATPLDMKAEADRHFLQGINQLVGHGWPYTVVDAEYPGWRFYAAGAFNESNPWWIVMPDVSRYLQRLSFLLRQGRPVTDVALYLADSDAWGDFSPGETNLIETLRKRLGPAVIARILEAGYNFDLFDDRALQAGRVEEGALTLGENRYRIVVLPDVETIPLESLRRLEEFARRGGLLVATRQAPSAPPGFRVTEQEKAVHTAIEHRLFRQAAPEARLVAEESQLANVLRNRVPPDVEFSPAAPEVGFVHRSIDGTAAYFVANTSNLPQQIKAAFRFRGLGAELWDPLTGRMEAVPQTAAKDRTTVALNLAPYGSVVVLFSKETHSVPAPASKTGNSLPTLDWSEGWQVTFGESGPTVTMQHLRSWTEDRSTRYFSGVAVYEKRMNVPEAYLKQGITLRMQFGESKPRVEDSQRYGMQAWLDTPVREAALIYVNGRRAGSLWCPPYSVDVSGLVRAGDNDLRITVGNVALNRMAGRALPDYRLLNMRYGARFEPQDMDKVRPEPSGLLGRIRLVAVMQ